MPHNLFNSLQEFKLKSGKTGKYYSLAALEKAGLGKVSRLPVSLRVVLESVLRNCDGKRVTEDAVKALAAWKPKPPAVCEAASPGTVKRALTKAVFPGPTL